MQIILTQLQEQLQFIFEKVNNHFDPRIILEFYKQLFINLRQHVQALRLQFQKCNQNDKEISADDDIYLEMDLDGCRLLFGKYVDQINHLPQFLKVLSSVVMINQLNLVELQEFQLQKFQGGKKKNLSFLHLDFINEEISNSNIQQVVNVFCKHHLKYLSRTEDLNQSELNLFNNIIRGSEIYEKVN